MATWNEWKDKAANLTRAGVGKAKEISEVARLNLDNVAEEEKIKKAYLAIGRQYVIQHPEGGEPEYEAFFQQIDQAKAKIAANKARIDGVKQNNNILEE